MENPIEPVKPEQRIRHLKPTSSLSPPPPAREHFPTKRRRWTQTTEERLVSFRRDAEANGERGSSAPLASFTASEPPPRPRSPRGEAAGRQIVKMETQKPHHLGDTHTHTHCEEHTHTQKQIKPGCQPRVNVSL